MHLLYYDEVKYDPPKQPSFWLGGVCAEDTAIPNIEDEINAISEEVFGSALLSKDTEFHGIEVCQGKGHFKSRKLKERIELLSKLLAVAARDDVYRIYVRIIPENIIPLQKLNRDPDEIAFMYFIVSHSRHLLIGDNRYENWIVACCSGAPTRQGS